MSANAGRKQDTRFKPGQSGNPAGKPKGARHRITLAIDELLEGEAETITRKAIDMALAGETVATFAWIGLRPPAGIALSPSPCQS